MISILLTIALLTLPLGIAAQTNNETMTLNKQQQSLAVIACLEAKGDQSALATAIAEGFDNGLTISQAKEALSQLYAYTGFPRSLNALGTLQRVIEERKAQGKPADEGRDASPLPADYDALRQGTAVQTQLTGTPFNYAFAPATDYYLKAHLFGDIFARDNLTPSDREIVTVAALCGLDGVMPQLMAHVRGAINMGNTAEQVEAIVDVLAEHVGPTEAYRCRKAIATALGRTVDEHEMDIKHLVGIADSPYPIGQPNTAFAQYFIGNSYLAPMQAEQGGVVNVTFEPRCRNNWHIHHKAVQVLICVAGRGWYQEWGKDPVELKPGVVIAIPAEVKHWHGAARDSWMQHLTCHTNVEAGSSNEWCEPVTDELYNQLP